MLALWPWCRRFSEQDMACTGCGVALHARGACAAWNCGIHQAYLPSAMTGPGLCPDCLWSFVSAVAASPRPPRQAAAPQSLRDHLQGLVLQACPGAGWNGPADSAAVTVRRARRWALRRLQHGPASFPRLLTAFLDHLGQAGRGRGPCSDTVDVLERSLELLISEGRIACRGDLLIHRQ